MYALAVPPRSARRLAAMLACLACSVPAAWSQPAPDPARSQELERALTAFNADVHAPAWAAAVIEDGEIVAVAGVGVRDLQTGAPLDVATDQFHWGSVSKSVTATMLGGLVEDGVLAWDGTLAELLPDVPMRDEYRAVTLADLMNHRADLPPYTQLGPAEARRFQAYAGTNVEKRDAFVREVLQEAPPPRGGNELVYSNAGPAVAAHAAEIVTGRSWEELVDEYVFQRVGMATGGFGLPAGAAPDQTHGHAGPDADTLTSVGNAAMPTNSVMDAAGNVRSTVYDLALYAQAHLLGLEGADGPIDADTVRMLHTPPADGRTMARGGDYAMGWGLRREGGQTVHWHNGSAGLFFAQVELYPDEGLAIVVMTNAGFAGRSAPALIQEIHDIYGAP